MELFKDNKNLTTFALFNSMNAITLLLLGFYNYLLIPKLIAYGQSLGFDTSNFPFYARLFPALTVLLVFASNAVYLYAPRIRERAAIWLLLPAMYLFAANTTALLLPFAQLPEANLYFWMIGAMVMGFSVIIPTLETRRRNKLKNTASVAGGESLPMNHERYAGDQHLSNLSANERQALSEAFLQNCATFTDTGKTETARK